MTPRASSATGSLPALFMSAMALLFIVFSQRRPQTASDPAPTAPAGVSSA